LNPVPWNIRRSELVAVKEQLAAAQERAHESARVAVQARFDALTPLHPYTLTP